MASGSIYVGVLVVIPLCEAKKAEYAVCIPLAFDSIRGRIGDCNRRNRGNPVPRLLLLPLPLPPQGFWAATRTSHYRALDRPLYPKARSDDHIHPKGPTVVNDPRRRKGRRVLVTSD